MLTNNITVYSPVDGLAIQGMIMKREDLEKYRALVVIAHGMCEHKERYIPFMEFLCENGYICVAYDQRGHGATAPNHKELGYYGGKGKNAYLLAEDLHGVITYAKSAYPEMPVYLFGHSMGTLVARLYFSKHSHSIYKLVLSGMPNYNGLAGIAKAMVKFMKKKHGDAYRSDKVKQLSMGSFNKGNEVKNAWLSYNMENVEAYNADKLCGFTFTLDAFHNLFAMMEECYNVKGYQKINRDCAMLFIAGEDDPVIENQHKFLKTVSMYRRMGVRRIKQHLFPHMRHEILSEDNKQEVYKMILDFLMGNL